MEPSVSFQLLLKYRFDIPHVHIRIRMSAFRVSQIGFTCIEISVTVRATESVK